MSRMKFPESWNVRAIAIITGLMGLVNLLSAASLPLADRLQFLHQVMPLEIRHGSRLTAALAGFALVLLAGSLWRRKHTAWLVTLIVLVVSAVSNVLKGLDFELAILAFILAVWMLLMRRHFYAQSDTPSMRSGVKTLALALLFTLLYGTLGFYLMDRQFNVRFSLVTAIRETLVLFSAFYDPGLEPITHLGKFFIDSIYMVGVATLGYALLTLVRPVWRRQFASDLDHQRAADIVEVYGRTCLARFALLNDKSYFFSRGGSLIAFAARGRAALALGDPIGPVEDLPAALSEFKAYCQRNDWIPAFYQTLPDNLAAYKQAGYDALCIGQEALVDLTAFTLQSPAMKPLRNAVNRIIRLGHTAHRCDPPLSPELLSELRAISDEWLEQMNGSEQRFSLGWFDDVYIGGSRVMVIKTPEGQISAFANLVSGYQRKELSVDLMRHRGHIESGTMDFLFVNLFNWAADEGFDSFNMGLSALSGVGEHSDDPDIERALHYIFEHINQFYHFKGLHSFKEKFNPQWSPRFLVYPGLPSLPIVGSALARVHLGDHLLQDFIKK